MKFSDLMGQDISVRLFKNAIRDGRVAHAYLFAGPEGSGKKSLALALASALNCEAPGPETRGYEPCGECPACRKIDSGQHPDVSVIAPDGPRLKIEQMRSLQRANSFRAYEGRYKVFILDRVETMTEQAANSLLKVLEEPLGDTVFALLTGTTASVLPTLISRCVTVSMRPLPEEEMARELESRRGIPLGQARPLAALAQGSFGKALQSVESFAPLAAVVSDLLAAIVAQDRVKLMGLASDYEKQREQAEGLIDALTLAYSRMLGAGATGDPYLGAVGGQAALLQDPRGVEVALTALTLTRRAFQSNVNVRLALEVLFLQLVRCHHGGAPFQVYQEAL